MSSLQPATWLRAEMRAVLKLHLAFGTYNLPRSARLEMKGSLKSILRAKLPRTRLFHRECMSLPIRLLASNPLGRGGAAGGGGAGAPGRPGGRAGGGNGPQ